MDWVDSEGELPAMTRLAALQRANRACRPVAPVDRPNFTSPTLADLNLMNPSLHGTVAGEQRAEGIRRQMEEWDHHASIIQFRS